MRRPSPSLKEPGARVPWQRVMMLAVAFLTVLAIALWIFPPRCSKQPDSATTTNGLTEGPLPIAIRTDTGPLAAAAVGTVSVGGGVRNPRSDLPFRDGLRLYQAIMQCGGFTEFASLRKIKLIRGDKEFLYDIRNIIALNRSRDPILMAGDTIVVPQD